MSNAMMSAGGAKDRGQYQWAGGVGNGTENGTAYIAFNAIPEGEYRAKGAAWAPEIRAGLGAVEDKVVQVDRNGVLETLRLKFAGGWEVIGYGGHMGGGMGGNLTNSQNYISWANGWSASLPYGTYRVLAVYGDCSDGGVHIGVSIGGKNVNHSYGTYWNCDDVTFTGSGALRVFFDSNLAYRNPSGVLIIVLHQ